MWMNELINKVECFNPLNKKNYYSIYTVYIYYAYTNLMQVNSAGTTLLFLSTTSLLVFASGVPDNTSPYLISVSDRTI